MRERLFGERAIMIFGSGLSQIQTSKSFSILISSALPLDGIEREDESC
jgi:hypothetical protein